MLRFILISVLIGLSFYQSGNAQKPLNSLTFEEVVKLAKDQSPQAVLAKHRFRAAYWQHRTFVAEFRPSLKLGGSIPQFNRSIKRQPKEDGTYSYVEENTNITSAQLSLSQNIGFTGGTVSVISGLERTDLLDSSLTFYMGNPVSINLRQPIFGMNSLKWSKKIEPLKYEEAKRNYIQSLESISMEASRIFFDLAMAQQNLLTAKLNYSNTDTLYKIAQGRYNIGTIAENELLQMELSFLNAGSNLSDAEVDLQLKKQKLKSYLGLNDQYDIEIILPTKIPSFDVVYDEILSLSKQNNPVILSYERQLIEANRDVAQARSERGFSADLYANYGFSKSALNIPDIYKDPKVSQSVTIGIEIPILDWGLGKGKVKMAQSNREVVKTTVDQALTDFEQDVFLKVMQFNRQDDQVLLAEKADNISQNRYEVTKQRFLIGKIDVLDLNIAQSERDQSKQRYINALSSFWQYYYQMRRLTLYDLETKQSLKTDFELLLK